MGGPASDALEPGCGHGCGDTGSVGCRQAHRDYTRVGLRRGTSNGPVDEPRWKRARSPYRLDVTGARAPARHDRPMSGDGRQGARRPGHGPVAAQRVAAGPSRRSRRARPALIMGCPGLSCLRTSSRCGLGCLTVVVRAATTRLPDRVFEHELTSLHEIGAHAVQGYLLGRPASFRLPRTLAWHPHPRRCTPWPDRRRPALPHSVAAWRARAATTPTAVITQVAPRAKRWPRLVIPDVMQPSVCQRHVGSRGTPSDRSGFDERGRIGRPVDQPVPPARVGAWRASGTGRPT